MDEWVGKDENLLISRWGAPDRTAQLTNGEKTLTWIYTSTDAEHTTGQCRRSMTIAPDGKVKSWSASNCNVMGRVKAP